ncbi:MAG: GNAT family N-acetyltransferase [Flavobacteriales bacterium]
MAFIRKASFVDSVILAEIGKLSFVQSHGTSAAPEEIEKYIQKHMSEEVFKAELANPLHGYHILEYNGEPVGYSKIILDADHKDISMKGLTKLERIYLLEKFHGLKLGHRLFEYNLQLSKAAGQVGMWLFVWVKNTKAINFYIRLGFEISGSHDFQISENHSNPNHILLLRY